MIDAERIASAFLLLLRMRLSGEEWNEMVARQKAMGGAKGTCASHEFVDANEVMLRAMQLYGVSCEDRKLWNAAWGLAIEGYTGRCPKVLSGQWLFDSYVEEDGVYSTVKRLFVEALTDRSVVAIGDAEWFYHIDYDEDSQYGVMEAWVEDFDFGDYLYYVEAEDGVLVVRKHT